jgi:hydrogenase maturation factor
MERSAATEIVDIAIPANAQAVAEALGLTVSRSVTDGARVRGIPQDEAEIAIALLHDHGFVARIIEITPPVDPVMGNGAREAA